MLGTALRTFGVRVAFPLGDRTIAIDNSHFTTLVGDVSLVISHLMIYLTS